MKSQFLILAISLSFLCSCQSQIQKDYVDLVIPTELQDNPKAVDYLEEDAEQLNRIFNSLDDLATEFEGIAELVSQVDTNDVASIEAIRPEAEKRVEKLSRSFGKFYLNLMWYAGKDMFASSDATKGILERLDTDEGVAFKKSLKHIKLKKDSIKARAELFVQRLDELELDTKTD